MVLSSHIALFAACIANYVHDDHARSHTPPSADIPKEGLFVAWPQSRGPLSCLHFRCCSLLGPCVRLPSWWLCVEGISLGGAHRTPYTRELASFEEGEGYEQCCASRVVIKIVLVEPVVCQETRDHPPSSGTCSVIRIASFHSHRQIPHR